MPRSFFRKLTIPTNISTYLSRSLILITVATTILIGSVLIILQTIYFNQISRQKSKEYIEYQKTYIQEIVRNELQYIRIQNEEFKRRINEKIRQNVLQSIHTAESIYQKYNGKKTEEEIKSLIIATISSLKFEMAYEEVFISSMSGEGVYYPRKPEFTGMNMLQFKDANGSSVVMEEIRLLSKKDEGFLDYDIPGKSSDGTAPNKKLTFVKKFGRFNWYFGSKQYVDDYFPKFKAEIAQKISSVRFRHGGYVFMNQIDGVPIVMDGVVYSGNLNMLTNTSDRRHEIFMKQIDAISKNPEGAFFYYQWNKMNETEPSEKCSYVQLFQEYNWIVGAGFYVDEINQSIEDQQKLLHKDQQRSVFTILLILIALLVLETIIIYHFNKKYKSDFERFFNFFYLSQNSFNKLNISEFYFDEFKRAGVAANKMIMLREETEARLIEEQQKAQESDRLKSAFLANMSHEIRTPMNAIIGFSDLLQDDEQDEQDKKTFVKLIRKNGEILLNLINDIIDISKIEANLLTIRKRPVKLNKFLSDLGNHYTDTLSTMKGKNIEFSIESNLPDQTIIQTDEVRLRQILDNLIGNAFKFTASGWVKVEANLQADKVLFSVADTGIGIPKAEQVTIFERFMQAEQNQKTNFGGTGLGLAISKNLIELLGGTIHVESEPGKGSTFYFSIQSS